MTRNRNAHHSTRPAVLPDCFELIPSWMASGDADLLLQQLTGQAPWEHPGMFRGHPIPRLTAWFGDGVYTYSTTTYQPMPWLPELDDLRTRVEEATGARYNSCLANLYRHGRDSVGWHADDEAPLGERPTIASVSLGVTRDFNIKRKDRSGLVTIPLGHGDLLVMRNESQLSWLHCLPKRPKVTARRVNLTFRWFDSPDLEPR